jgi:hypothetical protein
MAHLHELV